MGIRTGLPTGIFRQSVDLFYREGPKAVIDPWAIRAAVARRFATTNRW